MTWIQILALLMVAIGVFVNAVLYFRLARAMGILSDRMHLHYEILVDTRSQLDELEAQDANGGIK